MLAAREYAKELGFKIVIDQSMRRGAIDVSSQIMKLKNAGVDHVVILGMLRSCASTIKEMKKLNWRPNVYFFLPPVDPQYIDLLRENALWPKRTIGIIGTPLPGTNKSGVKETEELIKKYDPKHKITTYTIVGLGYAKVLVEGLRRVGPNLTRESFIKAMETFRDYDNGVHCPLTYGIKMRGELGKALVYEIKKVNSKIDWVLISDWREYKEF